MRFGYFAWWLTCGCLLGIASARADHQPVIAVPGGNAPVIINGYDASGAVIEGDWGLYRPGHGQVTVYYPYFPSADYWTTRSYYPFTGKRPRYGRHEIIPPANRPLPPPAASFYRYWSTGSDPLPAQIEYPADPPPVIRAPRLQSKN